MIFTIIGTVSLTVIIVAAAYSLVTFLFESGLPAHLVRSLRRSAHRLTDRLTDTPSTEQHSQEQPTPAFAEADYAETGQRR